MGWAAYLIERRGGCGEADRVEVAWSPRTWPVPRPPLALRRLEEDRRWLSWEYRGCEPQSLLYSYKPDTDESGTGEIRLLNMSTQAKDRHRKLSVSCQRDTRTEKQGKERERSWVVLRYSHRLIQEHGTDTFGWHGRSRIHASCRQGGFTPQLLFLRFSTALGAGLISRVDKGNNNKSTRMS